MKTAPTLALVALASAAFALASSSSAQTPPAAAAAQPLRPDPPPPSPTVGADGRVTFRLRAPAATSVGVRGEFAPFGQPPLAMTKDDKGIWSATTAAIAPGAYRYTFIVDGAETIDAGNLATSASETRLGSLVVVPGQPWEAMRPDVPHGAVAAVFYPSKYGGGLRRMHVYTPPGYGRGTASYPVLYLLHGGGDSDDGWWTVGRAGAILDNLIAAGKARPMIVVMPDGNADPKGQVMTGDPALEPFGDDLVNAIIPYVEENYRAVRTADARALAGLSMGGIQTLNIGFTNLDRFHALGIFSSGFFPADQAVYEQKVGPTLKGAAAKLKVFYFAYGETDIAKPQAESNILMFARFGLHPKVEVTDRGHEWYNWRRYLVSFAPLLFR